MEYQWLYQIKYSNRLEYENSYSQRFNSVSTHHYNFNIKGFPAFIMVTPEILRLISEINSLDKQIIKTQKTLPELALEQFMRNCLIDEVKQTNDIEGIVTTRKEIKDALNKNNKNSRIGGLVQKYFLLSKSDTIDLITCQDIRNLYEQLVLSEVALSDEGDVPDGEIFRKEHVYVKDINSGEVIHSGIYPEAEIITTMSLVLSHINSSDFSSLVNISMLHFMFGYIHPFYDGNGRTSRFISSYLLSKELENIVGYRLAYTIKKNINQYYKMFKLTNEEINRGDLTPFVIYFLEIIRDSMKELVEYLIEKSQRLAYYYNKIEKFDVSPACKEMCYILLQNSMFAYDGLSITDLSKILGKSSGSTRSNIKILQQLNLIKITIERPYLYNIDLHEMDKF